MGSICEWLITQQVLHPTSVGQGPYLLLLWKSIARAITKEGTMVYPMTSQRSHQDARKSVQRGHKSLPALRQAWNLCPCSTHQRCYHHGWRLPLPIRLSSQRRPTIGEHYESRRQQRGRILQGELAGPLLLRPSGSFSS